MNKKDYIRLCNITLHYTTLHYITSHYITLHYITLHHITSHHITLRYVTLHYCYPQTVDPKFDEVEQRVLSLEALLRTMVRDIQSWQEEMQVCILLSIFLYSSGFFRISQ